MSDKMISVWPYETAPQWMKDIGTPDDVDWVAFVPEGMYVPQWMVQAPFAYCQAEQYPVSGGIVVFGCHA